MVIPRAEELPLAKYIFLLDRKSPEQSEDLIKGGKKNQLNKAASETNTLWGKEKKKRYQVTIVF